LKTYNSKITNIAKSNRDTTDGSTSFHQIYTSKNYVFIGSCKGLTLYWPSSAVGTFDVQSNKLVCTCCSMKSVVK